MCNEDLLLNLVDPRDYRVIREMPVGSANKLDSLGCHFTKTGKYTVKSGYHTQLATNGCKFLAVYFLVRIYI